MRPTIFLSKFAAVSNNTSTGFVHFDTSTNTFSITTAGGSSLPWSSITGTPNTLSGYGITDAASLASPAFTGTPIAPTPPNGTNNNQVATTAFVLANAVIGSSSSVASVPVGTILPFTGTTAPAGFLLCPAVATNISRTTYPDLFAVIGTTWGAGDGSTTFGIPFFPTGYTTTAGVLGTSSVGSVLAHTHGITNNFMTGVGSIAFGGIGGNLGELAATTSQTPSGTAINQAAGVNVQYIIAYLPNNGIAASLSNYATTSFVQSSLLGVGQTWQDMTASRLVGTPYTNNTGKPIQVSVSCYNTALNGQTKLVANSIQVAIGEAYSANADFTLSAIIPNGTTYQVVSISGSTTIMTWAELR